MGFGILLLMAVFAIFVITHMIRFDGDVDSAELAATVALILFLGFVVYGALYFLRGLI